MSWQLSSQDAENCCTHNLLKLTKLLWQQAPRARYADYYERALWNGILGTKSPDDAAAIMYYVPMQAGLYRYYGEGDNGYACCNGTGIESFSKFGEFVYAKGPGELWVNLFTPSEVDWAELGVKLRQQTQFPDEQRTTLAIAAKAPVKFALRVRVPFWCKDGFALAVNGEAAKVAASDDGYAAIEREWHDGDKVEVSLPMTTRTEPLGDDHSLVAVCCGPIVVAMDLGTNEMSAEMRRGLGEEAYRRNLHGPAGETPWLYLDPKAPKLALDDHLRGWATASDLNRRTYPLQPFYRTRGRRYAVYVGTTETVVRVDRFDDGIDSVDVGTDRSGNFQAWQSKRGESHGKAWVRSPLWFRYDLDVGFVPDNVLRITFARDEDATPFELCVDGVVVATPTLQPPPGDAPIFTQDFTLPRSATDGRKRVAIMIRVPPPPKDVDAKAGPRRTPRVFALATNPSPSEPDIFGRFRKK